MFKFYKDADGVWHLNNYIVPPGAVFMETYEDEKVDLYWLSRKEIFSNPVPATSFTKEDGTPYANLAELKAATADFFFRLSPYMKKDGSNSLVYKLQFVTGIIQSFDLGQIGWNDATNCLEAGLGDGSTLSVGFEDMTNIQSDNSGGLLDFKALMFTGTSGNSGKLLADYYHNGNTPPFYFMGASTANIDGKNKGRAVTRGLINGVRTDGYGVPGVGVEGLDYEVWVDGEFLYPHKTHIGFWTKHRPVGKGIKIPQIAIVNAHPTNGSAYIRLTINHRMEDLYDVDYSQENASIIDNDESIVKNTVDGFFKKFKFSSLYSYLLGKFSSLTVPIKFGSGANYSQFESDGTLKMEGEAIYWRDIDFPIIARTVASNQPTPTTLALNIQAPAWAVNDYYNCDGQELVHEWKEGSTCYWHCHLITNGLDIDNRYIKFELQYAYADVNGVLVSDTITTDDILIPANTADRTMKIISIGNFTPTNNKIATHVYARLKRLASTGTAPTNNPFIPMLQMHIICDTLGSRTMIEK